jgi:hypothetical protein
VPGRERLVVGLERLLALLDLSADDAAVDLDLEAADGRALVERELRPRSWSAFTA